MSDQDRAAAAVFFQGPAYLTKDALQGVLFGYRRAQRVIGINAVDLQGFWVDMGTFKRLDMKSKRFTAADDACVCHIDEDRGDFKQSVSRGAESAGLNVDDNRQEATKPACHRR